MGVYLGTQDVNFLGGTPVIEVINQNKTVTPSGAVQLIQPDAGYTGLGSVTVNAIPGSYVQPTDTKGAATYYPSTSDQSIASGTYLTGLQTIKALAIANLTADNIKSGVTVTVGDSADADRVLSVTGTYSGDGGGGSGDIQVGEEWADELSVAGSTLTFSNLLGEPTSFYIVVDDDLSTGAQPWKIASVVYDGVSFHGQIVTNTSNANASYLSSGFSMAYSNNTLTITSTDAYFQPTAYLIWYTYGGSSANISTQDVQVGSGATSITFTGLSEEPIMWSCIFKSNFGTSSGYQRVMSVGHSYGSLGVAMDSSAHSMGAWSYTYNNGSLTITSQGTNNGGYFHQPGNYQLTYAIGGEPPEIETEPITITENGTYTAPSGKAYTPVTVNVSGGGGSSDVVMGTLTVASNVNTSTSTQITTTSTIGFTPTKFFFWKSDRTATSNHVHQASFITIGSYYIRTMTRYSSNALSTSGNTNNWTTQTAGYLYFNSDTIYFRSSSSYILSSGTWYWVAVK